MWCVLQVVACLQTDGDVDQGAGDKQGKTDASLESFYEVAKWLTELASRAMWIRDTDDEAHVRSQAGAPFITII